MAKKEYITRYLMLIKRIKKGNYPSYQELLNYVTRESEYLQDEFYVGFSKRTLQRDIQEIRAIFGIEINYSRKQKGYFIDSEISQNYDFNQMLETYDVLQLFKTKEQTKEFLFFEQTKPKGTEFFNGILYAIQHRKKLIFDYEKFWEGTIRKRTVLPLGLKECNNRWYVVAKNENNKLRTYALDRFHSFTVSEKYFDFLPLLNIDELYEFNYGISINKNLEPKEIVFTTDLYQAKYFKSLPLHHTQKVKNESSKETTFSLNLKVNDELIYKFLSYGDRVKVTQPLELVKELSSKIEKMNKMYS